jgi:hypothetical protein
MTSDDAPKSSYELAMERLRKKDKEAGLEERPVTGEQKTKIAEIRKVAEAKLAEREILHHASLRKAEDPEAYAKLEEDYRRDRERIASERDSKIEKVRRQ